METKIPITRGSFKNQVYHPKHIKRFVISGLHELHELWILTDMYCLNLMQVYLPGITTSTQGESGRLGLRLVTRKLI